MIATGLSRRSGWGGLLAARRGVPGRPRVRAEAPLTLALTPSRDPTALQEAGDAFAKAITSCPACPFAPRSRRTTRA